MHTKQIHSQYQFLYQLDKLKDAPGNRPKEVQYLAHDTWSLWIGWEPDCVSSQPLLRIHAEGEAAMWDPSSTTDREENIACTASQSFSPEMSHIILVHISLVQRGHA